jgi:hypothetical protein
VHEDARLIVTSTCARSKEVADTHGQSAAAPCSACTSSSSSLRPLHFPLFAASKHDLTLSRRLLSSRLSSAMTCDRQLFSLFPSRHDRAMDEFSEFVLQLTR